MKRLATFLVGAGVAAGAVLSVSAGEAAAKIVADSAKFPHVSSLQAGKLSVTVTNAAPWQGNCTLEVFDAKDLPVLKDWSAAATGWTNGTVSEAEFKEKGAKVKALPRLKTGLETTFFPAGEKRTVSWDSRRPDTAYAVNMNCGTYGQTGDEFFAYDAFKVSGTGANEAGGANGSLDGLGLGNLLPK